MSREIKKGDKLQILQYPELGIPDVMTVRVVKVFKGDHVKPIVRYRYNWPFPMNKDMYMDEFKKIVVEEVA